MKDTYIVCFDEDAFRFVKADDPESAIMEQYKWSTGILSEEEFFILVYAKKYKDISELVDLYNRISENHLSGIFKIEKIVYTEYGDES